MIIRWRGDRVLADRQSVAELYGVSVRTVRRHCPVVAYDPGTGAALVDALAAETHLDGVYPRDTARAYPAIIAGMVERRWP